MKKYESKEAVRELLAMRGRFKVFVLINELRWLHGGDLTEEAKCKLIALFSACLGVKKRSKPGRPLSQDISAAYALHESGARGQLAFSHLIPGYRDMRTPADRSAAYRALMEKVRYRKKIAAKERAAVIQAELERQKRKVQRQLPRRRRPK